MTLPTSIEILMLSNNDWVIEHDTQRVIYARNKFTGCQIRGQHAHDFVLEKIKELKEEDSPSLSIEDRYKALESKGYVIECESPLELLDPNGDKITGECANFVIYFNT